MSTETSRAVFTARRSRRSSGASLRARYHNWRTTNWRTTLGCESLERRQVLATVIPALLGRDDMTDDIKDFKSGDVKTVDRVGP